MMSRSGTRFVLLVSVVLNYALFCDAASGMMKKKVAEEATAVEEATRLANLLLVVFGMEMNKKLLYGLTGMVTIALSVAWMLKIDSSTKARGNRPGNDAALDVVVVATGLPKKGMGWYHLTQLLEMPKVNVVAVVEPFFMNPKQCPSVPPSFAQLVKTLQEQGVQVTASVDDLSTFKRPTMCLIAGRTPDNPHLFSQCIDKGASVIYLEKPGAPSVQELQEMKNLADSRNVKVYLGYNKNVTPYIQKAVALTSLVPESHVFFCHCNSYTRAELPECFTRNSEGILKNMAIHELALLVSFFDVTVDTIEKFKVNTSKLFSEKLKVRRPGTQRLIADFSRVTFTVTNKKGTHVSVMADRCGGNVSYAVVKDGNGQDVQKFEFPDIETAAKVEEQVKADPEMMPYFFVQGDDYLELKNRVIDSTLSGSDAPGVATIQVGIEALKLAEYGTEELNKILEA